MYTAAHGMSRRTIRPRPSAGPRPEFGLRSLRARLLAAFLIVVATALGAVGLSLLVVSPGYFADAMGHLPGDPMGEAMDAVTREAFAHAMQRSLAAATLVAIATAAVVGFTVAAGISRPVTRLVTASRRLAEGRYGERVPTDELGERADLATSFNDMAESLEATERRRLQLVGDVAHELRTPLTTLDGYLEGLEDGVVQPGAPTWQLLRTETGRLTRLVSDLAELWRAEAQQLALHPMHIDVADVARQVQARFTPSGATRDVTIEVSGVSVAALADPDRLAQVLSNYMSNALRLAPEGTTVRLVTDRVGDRALVSVIDDGPGLAPSQLEAVFERFYRVDAARSRSAGGSGIGLAIARAVAAAMGGRAWAESRGPGLGARFMIEFPID